ncbi:MAG TPA: AAA family ATPase [Patescibacteria group bacterium]|nr:AAA family ATPase [Patescibacteria group bacterium]
MEKNWGVIGHQNIVEFLQQSIKRERLAHAYLFYGLAGLGKAETAKKFAAEIIGHNIRLATELFELSPAEDKKNITIEQVREWRRSMSLKSFSKNYKVGIIYEAEKLNRESANALLKTLEEPAQRTVIIIIASDWSNLLQTIVSRSQQIKFLQVSQQDIKRALKDKVADSRKLEEIISWANGRPALAVRLAEDENYFNEIRELKSLARKLITSKLSERWEILSREIDALKNSAEKVSRGFKLVEYLEADLREELTESLSVAPADNRRLLKLLNLAGRSKIDLWSNVQPRLVLENLLINL